MNRIIEKLFFVKEWKPFFRYLSASEQALPLEEYCSQKHSYKEIVVPKGHWAADTFVYSIEDEVYVFFEYTDVKKNKAVIGAKKIDDNSNLIICHEFDGHTSYPAIFEWDGQVYMVPETCYADAITLLRNIEWPCKWVEERKLIEHGRFPDTTPFVFNKSCYFYVYKEESDRSFLKLYAFANEKLKHYVDVCEYPKGVGRPAGNVLLLEEKAFRPTQHNVKYYGEYIDFYEIDLSSFSEKKAFSYDKENIIVSSKRGIVGIHTFNRHGNVEVIDVLYLKFDFFKSIKRLFAKLSLFGFADYDKRKRRLYQ